MHDVVYDAPTAPDPLWTPEVEKVWRANWDATAVTHAAVVAAFDAQAKAEEAWMVCSRASTPPADLSCACGGCGQRWAWARQAVEDAKAAHDVAVETFKTTGAPELVLP